ncbi:tetratricopeptide repeat protein, partial [Limosilactobacillus reuteri]|uniref:tetratricopeptide repeat protein n=1 Tax=Limosilactobacillus reuteri TaxID=1598 RepID=UPI00207C56FC
AYFYYRKAEKIYEILENREMMSKMYYNKAYLLFYEGNYLESEIQVSRSLKLIKSSNNKQVIFTCYNLLASNFEKMEEYDEALKYY